jgi:hypothetical protein
MAHGSLSLLFSRRSRLEFPGSDAIRQLWRVVPPFITAVFSREGMLTREGRILIRGKFRRLLICSVSPLARHLRTHYGLQGGCNSCGASCNLLFPCPHWDTDSRLCTVYESRPSRPPTYATGTWYYDRRSAVPTSLSKKRHFCNGK